jgi:hypothetical protein
MGHGSHGSYSSTTTENHSSTISSQTLSTSSAAAHSATIGGVDWSGSFSSDTKLGNYGSTGSLNEIASILNSMRTRVETNSDGSAQLYDSPDTVTLPNDSTIPSYSTTTGVLTEASTFKDMLHNERVYCSPRYQPFTLNINITSTVTSNTTSGPDTGSTQTGAIEATKTQDIKGNVNTTTTSWTSKAVGKKGTTSSYTYTDNLSGKVIKSSTIADPSASLTSIAKGSKITKEQASQILKALQDNTLQQYTGPASKTFSWSGYNNISHSNHGSYSSG